MAGWEGAVGCGFPAVVKDGVVQTAANIDKTAIGFDLGKALERDRRPCEPCKRRGRGRLAEVRWGAGRLRAASS